MGSLVNGGQAFLAQLTQLGDAANAAVAKGTGWTSLIGAGPDPAPAKAANSPAPVPGQAGAAVARAMSSGGLVLGLLAAVVLFVLVGRR